MSKEVATGAGEDYGMTEVRFDDNPAHPIRFNTSISSSKIEKSVNKRRHIKINKKKH